MTAMGARRPRPVDAPGANDDTKQRDSTCARAATPSHLESLVSADELIARQFAPITWIVPDIIPAGVALLCGSPKIGKSWLALDLAIAVASGGAAFGVKPCDPGSVLYLALEDNQRRLRSRLLKRLQGAKGPSGLALSTRWPRIDQGAVRELDAWLTANPDSRLVLVDTLARLRPPSRANHPQYETDYAVGAPLLDIAARHDVGIVLVHHTRKADAEDPLDLVSGTLGLSAGVDGILILRRDRRSQEASLFVTGRDIEHDGDFALAWNPATAAWTLTGAGASAVLSPEKRKVFDLIRQHGPIAGRDLTRLLNPGAVVSRESREWARTRSLVKKLIDSKLVEKVPNGGYVVASGYQEKHTHTDNTGTRDHTVTQACDPCDR